MFKIRLAVLRAFLARSAEQGARQSVWAALGPDGKEGPHVRHALSGAYVSLAQVHEPSDLVISKEGYDAQEKIWVRHFLVFNCASHSSCILFFQHETIEILAKVAPAVRTIVDEHLSN